MATTSSGAAVDASSAFWASLDPYTQCRVATGISTSPPADSGISAGPGTVSQKLEAKLWHPDNPLFWFGLLAGGTALAMALSTGTVRARASAGGRVGPLEGSASAGVGDGGGED